MLIFFDNAGSNPRNQDLRAYFRFPSDLCEVEENLIFPNLSLVALNVKWQMWAISPCAPDALNRNAIFNDLSIVIGKFKINSYFAL